MIFDKANALSSAECGTKSWSSLRFDARMAHLLLLIVAVLSALGGTPLCLRSKHLNKMGTGRLSSLAKAIAIACNALVNSCLITIEHPTSILWKTLYHTYCVIEVNRLLSVRILANSDHDEQLAQDNTRPMSKVF